MEHDQHYYFSQFVKKHFAYLVNEFEFRVVEDEYRTPSCIVIFQGEMRYVALVWDLKDGEIYSYICKNADDCPASKFDFATVKDFPIFLLVLSHEPTYDWRFITEMRYWHPDIQLLEEKISRNAELLYKYGREILIGKAWFDWKNNALHESG